MISPHGPLSPFEAESLHRGAILGLLAFIRNRLQGSRYPPREARNFRTWARGQVLMEV